MFKRLRCWLHGHIWKPYNMVGRLGNYPIEVCVHCERWRADNGRAAP